MTSSQNALIVWEKWEDPLLESVGQEPEYIDDTEQIYDDEQHILNSNEDNKQKITLFLTPSGPIPVTGDFSLDEIYNFWMAHTNFDITPNIASIVEKTDGVETLDILTRYRLRIGIGKIFTDRIVMSNINTNVYSYIKKIEESKETANELQQ